MLNTAKYSFDALFNMLMGKTAHFISDCEFFPMFNVIGKVMSMEMRGTEIIFFVKTTNNKIIQIGSKMKNLQFEVLN